MQKCLNIGTWSSVLLIIFLLMGCQQKIQKAELTKTWYFDHFEQNPKPKEELPEDITQEYRANFSLVYHADGRFESRFGNDSSTGEWNLSEDGKVLFSKDKTGKSQRYMIEEISKDKLAFTLQVPAGTMTFFMQSKPVTP